MEVKRFSLFLALALVIGSGTPLFGSIASAQNTRAVRATAELSMVLSGHIEVDVDGSVSDLELDQQSMLTPGISSIVDRTIRSWRFEPPLHNGKAIGARAPLRVRLRGKALAGGGYQVSIAGADFSECDPSATDVVTQSRMNPPGYPEEVHRSGGEGQVLLLLKVARDGTVADVIAEQVNMAVAAPEKTMAKLRGLLAVATVNSARSWTFNPPTTGPDRSRDFWTVRIPVVFALKSGSSGQWERYGRWRAFIPGPRLSAPWLDNEGRAGLAGIDLLPADGVYMVDGETRGLRLLTPFSQS